MQKSNKYRLTETGKPSFFSMTRGGISIPPVYMEHILTEKRQSCCAAGDQIIRKNKKGNSDSINQIAQGNDQKIVKGF